MANEPVSPTPPSDEAGRLAAASTADELQRLKLAEEVIALRTNRQSRTRLVAASQAMVGYIALAGFFVNAYQSYANKKEQVERSAAEQARWSKEFERAATADKYRAFFETSILATDPSNQDKRLVGYALLEEFVDDKAFNRKATLMLEEKLAQELRSNTADGLDAQHRASVVAILGALSQSRDCKALERAARTIDRVTRRHALVNDPVETRAVFRVYVDKVLGRATQACESMEDFRAVRQPIREVLMKIPEIEDLKGKVTPSQANSTVADLLREHCDDELSVTGVDGCPPVLKKYARLCDDLPKLKDRQEDEDACRRIRVSLEALTAQPAPEAPPSP